MTMKQEKKRIYLRAALALAALLVVLLALDNLSFVPSMLLTVLRKGAIYALVAVSMNLLNGFTGLFSLGQAGFMLLGAYTYAILTIPVAQRINVYQYFDGGIVQFHFYFSDFVWRADFRLKMHFSAGNRSLAVAFASFRYCYFWGAFHRRRYF